MKNTVRIAIRETATELTPQQVELVSGGRLKETCDLPTDSWVDGGDFVFNDD